MSILYAVMHLKREGILGTYVNSTLGNDEKVIYEARVSFWSTLPLLAAGTIFMLVGLKLPLAFIVGAVFCIAALIRYKTTELAITNKRVIAKFGLVSRNTIEMNLAKIESIQVHQSIEARLFGFGSLILSGAGTPQAPILGIANPLEFRKAFISAQEQLAAK